MCTNITLRGKKAIVTARTDEFALMMPTLEISTFVRGMEFTTLGDGSGLKWRNKYGYVGVSTGKLWGEKNILDGINEKGLAVQALYFPGYAGYEKINDLSNAVSNLSICNYILGKFETVEEVRDVISDMNIVGEALNGEVSPFHYQVNDRNGNSIVIETVGEKTKIYDNPIGTLTNSPDFDFHMKNLSNYMRVAPLGTPIRELKDITLRQFGMGNGLFGIPGDMTPPSRFVRAALYSQFAAGYEDSIEETVNTAFHILNTSDLVAGIARVKGSKEQFDKNPDMYLRASEDEACDITMFTIAKDLTNLKIYYKDYFNQNIRCIDMNKLNLEEGEERVRIQIFKEDTEKFIDITEKLN